MEPQMPTSLLDNSSNGAPTMYQQDPFAAQQSPSSSLLPLKTEPEHLTSSEVIPSHPRRKGFSYPFIGLITIVAGVVLAAQQYGLGNLIPYPLSGLIAAGFIILVGLWLLAKGRLGRLLSFWLGLVVVVVVGGMIYDTLYPGTLPRSGSWGITVGYEKEGNNLTLRLGTLPFSGSEMVIVPPTPLDDAIINQTEEGSDLGEDVSDNGLTGYTISISGSINSGTKE